MNKLPEEIEQEIFSYLITCGRHRQYIINKSTLSFYNKHYKECSPIKVFNIEICKNCNSDAIRFINYMKWSLY
tara:strand:- start:658 stop:876 length:219 start_codon:yes stop_codon:yes gene_type:complete